MLTVAEIGDDVVAADCALFVVLRFSFCGRLKCLVLHEGRADSMTRFGWGNCLLCTGGAVKTSPGCASEGTWLVTARCADLTTLLHMFGKLRPFRENWSSGKFRRWLSRIENGEAKLDERVLRFSLF